MNLFTKENITQLANQRISEFNGFVVDVIIANGNKIIVELDSPTGISIGQLENVNRFLNNELDNEVNEFELTVSSPGMEKPFKVHPQYIKNIGRKVRVKFNDGKTVEGLLQQVNAEEIEIVYQTKKKNEKNKKNE